MTEKKKQGRTKNDDKRSGVINAEGYNVDTPQSLSYREALGVLAEEKSHAHKKIEEAVTVIWWGWDKEPPTHKQAKAAVEYLFPIAYQTDASRFRVGCQALEVEVNDPKLHNYMQNQLLYSMDHGQRALDALEELDVSDSCRFEYAAGAMDALSEQGRVTTLHTNAYEKALTIIYDLARKNVLQSFDNKSKTVRFLSILGKKLRTVGGSFYGRDNMAKMCRELEDIAGFRPIFRSAVYSI